MKLTKFRNWVRHTLGVDHAIAFTVLARAWSSAAGVITVLLIARFLSPAEQGFYYTFGSLVALQIIFELGFSIVILQLASHERAYVTISPDGVVSGNPIAHERLASVLQKSVRWYTVASIIMACVLMPAGFFFFSRQRHSGPAIAWQIPWCLVVLATTLTFQIDPVLSFLEGCGYVANVARLRLAQAMLGGGLMWLALSTRHGLYAPAMMIFGELIAGSVWLYGRRSLLLGLLRYRTAANRILWTREVWPFQWRIAVSWICGYFIYQLFVPVLFAYKGAVAAGQIGMSLSIAGALSSVAIAWVNTKAAPFGALIARKEYEQLDSLFFRAVWHSIFVYCVGALLVWLGVVYLNVEHMRLAQRVLGPPVLGLLLLATLLNVIAMAQSIYLRAHKQEKYMAASIVSAILVGFSTYFFGKTYGAAGMVTGYLAIGLFGGIWYSTFLFVKYRREWHVT